MNITRLDYPAGPEDADFWVFDLDEKLWTGVVQGLFGNDDLSHSALRRWAEGTRPEYSTHVPFVAYDSSEAVAVAFMELPRIDNRHLAFLSIAVAETHRRRGIASALLERALEEARADGRTTFQAWTWEPATPSGTRTLSAAEGDGSIDPDSAGAAFLLGRGFRLVQVETVSGLTLPAQSRLDADAAAARAATSDDYDVVQWLGSTPQHWRGDVADLMVAMSTDVPKGDAALEAEVVDEERVASADEAIIRGGCESFYTAVRHVPSGRLVAFTRLIREHGRPVVDQWETLVIRGHRGRGLGWFAKTHSHAKVRSAWPETHRLITGNASENSYMLDINRRLGYVPIAASGWFELSDQG
ncbi:GNAT family N-acetyltransferase [Tessaracoccus sp. G1721]